MAEALERRTLLAAGGVDPTFNDISFTGLADATAMVIQPDGKILVAGAFGPGPQMYVARFSSTGQGDPSFNSVGSIILNIDPTASSATSLLLQPDGKILVGGTAGNPTTGGDFAVVRLLSGGTIDSSFGTNGVVKTDFSQAAPAGSSRDTIAGLALQPDRKIIAAGTRHPYPATGVTATDDFALARYTASGALDTTFGTSGKVSFDLGGAFAETTVAVATDVNGGIALACNSNQAGTSLASVLRFTVDGATDGTFGGGTGKITTRFGLPAGSSAAAAALVVRGDSSILLAGTVFNNVNFSNDFAVAAFTASGGIDNSFNGTGALTFDVGSGPSASDDHLLSMALQPNGEMILAGNSTAVASAPAPAVARVDLTGALDSTFGSGGRVTGRLTNTASCDAVAVQFDGNIVLAGSSIFGQASLMRLLGDDPLVTGPVGSMNANTGAGPDTVRFWATPAGDVTIVANGVAQLIPNPVLLTINTLEGNNTVELVGNSSSIASVTVAVPVGHDNLIVDGTSGNDTIMVVSNGLYDYVGMFTYPGNDPLMVRGFGGDDVIDARIAMQGPMTISGGDGNDSLYASQYGGDSISGGAGNDSIFARNLAADTIDGGSGTNSAGTDASCDVVTNIQTLLNSEIDGKVFSDANGNGVGDANELTIDGKPYLDLNNNGVLDAGEPTSLDTVIGETATTSQNFRIFYIPAGTYTVRVMPPPGTWTTTTPAGGSYTVTVLLNSGVGGKNFGLKQTNPTNGISGTVYYDANGNGTQDGGETGLAGRTVFVDSNDNGVLDSGEPTATTAAGGSYTIGGLDLRQYRLRQVLPAGWRETVPSSSQTEVGALVRLYAVGTVSGVNLGASDKAGITGTVFVDVNGDGTMNSLGGFSPDFGAAGRTVYLDLNNDGFKSFNDPSTTTDGTGRYTFGALAAGTYVVRSLVPGGDMVTSPASGTAAYTITLSGVQLGVGDFGTTTPVTVRGTIFNDVNGDGSQNAGEDGLAGWTMYIDRNNNSVLDAGDDVRTTDWIGRHSFFNVLPGALQFRVTPPSGWTATTPGLSKLLNIGSAQSNLNFNFGFKQTSGSAISGSVFNDTNGDGSFAGEFFLANQSVYLDGNNNGVLDAGEVSVLTTSSGTYFFSNLTAGTYTVRQVIPATYVQTTATTSGSYSVALSSGQLVVSQDFGDKPLNLTGGAFRLKLDADGKRMDVWTNTAGTGSPSQQPARSLLGPVVVTGTSGNDALVVDLSAGNPLPATGLSYNGAAGTADALTITGMSGGTATVNATTIAFSTAAAITYSNVESISVAGGAGNETLTQTAQPGAALSISGGAGNDTLNISGGTLSFTTDAVVGSANLSINVTGGSVSFGATQHLASLAITAPGAAAMTAAGSAATPFVLNTPSLALTGAAALLNLANNELLTTALSDSLRSQIITGQIFTAQSGGALGSLDLGGGQSEVRFTLLGDTNLDGKVDVTDLGNLASSYGAGSGARWVQGDTNNDAKVDVTDLGNLASNYGGSLGGLAAATPRIMVATPEGRPAKGITPDTASSVALAASSPAVFVDQSGSPFIAPGGRLYLELVDAMTPPPAVDVLLA